jgi:hypothetical protein
MTRNVFNGDVGIVQRIDAVEQQVVVRFDDRLVKYDFGELDEMSLAYEVTARFGVSGSFDPACHPALHAAATQPDLHGHHAR